MTRLERLTNVLIAAACVTVISDIVAARLLPPGAKPAVAKGSTPAYAAGERFTLPPSVSFQPTAPTLYLVVRETCSFCQASVPFYQELANTIRQRPERPLLVGLCNDTSQGCAAYFRKSAVETDRTFGVAPTHLKVAGTPTIILVDRNGLVRSVWRGKLSRTQELEVIGEATRIADDR